MKNKMKEIKQANTKKETTKTLNARKKGIAERKKTTTATTATKKTNKKLNWNEETLHQDNTVARQHELNEKNGTKDDL